MKFFAALSVFGLFTSVIATPVAVPAPAVEKRQYDAQLALLTSLYQNIQTYTGTINATMLALPADADDSTKAAAASTVNDAVAQITSLIVDASHNVGPAAKLRARQIDPAAIAGLIGQILTEISGALNLVLSGLGLGSLLGLGGLTSALSGLVAALTVVVDDLLAVVETLLNGILLGLSVALAGLTL